MSSDVGALSAFPGDVLYNVILYPLPSRDLYHFSQVSKGSYFAIQQVAKMSQEELCLKATVSFIKGKKDDDEADKITFSFTATLADLSEKVEQLAKKQGIVINKKTVSITLEAAIEEAPFFVPDQTVSGLLYQRFKVESLLRHASLIKSLLPNLSPEDAKYFTLPVNQPLDRLKSRPWDFPQLILFDFHTKNCRADELNRALCLIGYERVIGEACPELALILDHAIFSHLHTKDILPRDLADTLVSRMGKGVSSTFDPNHEHFDILGPIKGDGFFKKEPIDRLNVSPPHKMIEAGKTKNLAIAKFVFSHPNAADIHFRGAIGNLLLCAVRYRSPETVQMMLDHPDAKNIEDAVLDVALNDAKGGGEQEIAKAIEAFKAERAAEKSKQIPIEEKNAIESAISEIVQAVTAAKKIPDESNKDDKCIIS